MDPFLGNDKVHLYKADGSTHRDLRATKSSDTEFLFPRTDVPIDEGDLIVREIANDRTESYLVVDPNYHSGLPPSIMPMYLPVVKKSPITAARFREEHPTSAPPSE
jgi:hypothetical protein